MLICFVTRSHCQRCWPGISIETVAVVMGHNSIRTTEKYCSPSLVCGGTCVALSTNRWIVGGENIADFISKGRCPLRWRSAYRVEKNAEQGR